MRDSPQLPTMTLSTVSSSKLHCCLVVLFLFILIFLSLPLLLIYVANTRFEEQENSKPINKAATIGCATQLEAHCVQRPSNAPVLGMNDSLMTNQPLSFNGTIPSSLGSNNATTIDNNNNKPAINYCNETNSQANQSPSNEYRKYPIKLNAQALQRSRANQVEHPPSERLARLWKT